MRTLPRVLVLTLLPLLAAFPAYAEDNPAAPATKADPVIPSYSIEFLMPSSESKHLGGWKTSDSAVAGAPTEDGLTELAESCKLDDETFYVETTVLKQGSDKVGLAMVDIDENVYAFRAKLDAQAQAGGWVVRELGSPARVAILSGAQAGAAGKKLLVHVLYAIAEMAMNRVRGRSAMEATGQEMALEYVQSMNKLVPDSAVAHGIVGRVHWLRSLPKKQKEKPNKELQDKAIAAFTKALASGATHPPKGRVLVWISGTQGGMLLVKKDQKVLAAATRALEIAVKNEVDAPTNVQRYNNRYNLACAYTRAAKTNKAFEMLRKSIEVGKSLPPAAWRARFEHMEEKDTDLAPLRRDPRFSKLMADNRPPKPKKPRRQQPPPEPKDDKPKPKDGR